MDRLIALIAGYIIGSIPFGFVVAKIKGINILKCGSGNPGATNVARVVGKKYGILTFILDFLKGFLPIFFLQYFFNLYKDFFYTIAVYTFVGIILGHNFSVFLKLKGGKGVATTIGGLAILMPGGTIFGLLIWYSVFSITRFVSLASLCFAFSLPLTAYLFVLPKPIFYLTCLLTLSIVVRHIPNIKRLWNGTENRFSKNLPQ